MLNNFGKRLKQLREERGMTTRDFAHSADIAYSQVWTLESGKGDPTLTTLIAISRALGIPLADILPEQF